MNLGQIYLLLVKRIQVYQVYPSISKYPSITKYIEIYPSTPAFGRAYPSISKEICQAYPSPTRFPHAVGWTLVPEAQARYQGPTNLKVKYQVYVLHQGARSTYIKGYRSQTPQIFPVVWNGYHEISWISTMNGELEQNEKNKFDIMLQLKSHAHCVFLLIFF